MSVIPTVPFNFLGLPPEHCDLVSSRAILLPIPYEATTSYGAGTREGPYAIIRASSQVEFYDSELDCEPALRYGIHTLPFFSPGLGSPAEAVAQIADVVSDSIQPGKLLGVLGGEHAVSIGVARGLHRCFGEFTTVQIDAHGDLRDSYQDTSYSHACTARRICEISPIVQLGVRALDTGEMEFIRTNPKTVRTMFAEDMINDKSYLDELAEIICGKQTYLTFDVDALDSSIMPATGTPEPGGLTYYDILAIVRCIVASSTLIGFDCMELAPISGMHAPDFTTAKLIYKIIALASNINHGANPIKSAPNS